MFDYNTELAIKEMFLFQYVFADSVNTQYAFGLFCDIYGVDESERNEIIGLLDNKRLNSIRTINDCYRHSRIRQYYEMFCGGYVIDDERVEELIAIKSAVFEKAQNDKLVCAYEKSCGRSYDELVRLAVSGIVAAKRVLGILQMEGLYITQDVCAGRDNLRDAADWLDTQSLVTAIYYNVCNRQKYLDKLYTITQKTDYAIIVEQLQIQYGIENLRISDPAKMLEKAFIIGTAKREVCSSQLLRILRSNVLSEKDKRTVLLSGNKELISAVCGLPLQLECTKIDIKKGVEAVLNRADESEAVMSVLENNLLRDRNFYRCLCIETNSEYARNAYSDYLVNMFPEDNVVQIDVSSLLPMDLDATENNVFIRSCQEKCNNVYIIKLSGKIDERIVNLIKAFALSSSRKAFAVSRFGITIDLSAILPIFVCDGKNAKLFDGCVSVVKSLDVTEGEKELALNDILQKKQMVFSTGIITVEDGAKGMLLNIQTNKIDSVLDQAIMSQRIDSGPICLTADLIGKYIGDQNVNGTYGFGGTHAKK